MADGIAPIHSGHSMIHGPFAGTATAGPGCRMEHMAVSRQAEYLPCRHQRTGDGTSAPADKADGRARRRHRTAQSTGSNAVAAADEKHPGSGKGDRKS